MTIQLGTTLRNAMIGQYETTVGTSPKLQIRTGAAPADCAAADSGTLLAELALPSDWMTAATAGAISKNGAWSVAATGAGNGAHYRLKNTAANVCHEQGTVTASGGGGDMTLDNVSIAVGQTVTVTQWDRTQGGA
ncbi:MAG TPA: hypothetical protein PKE15_00125 [Ottowia sp.]|nr:hypothetical protein [Ottowia sp.]